MTATNDAPDHHGENAEDRWQHIQHRIADLEQRIRTTSATAIAALDTRLARLDAIRQSLAQDPWPPPATPGKPPAVPARQPAQATAAHGRRPAHPADHRSFRPGAADPQQSRAVPATPAGSPKQAARAGRAAA
ncbi:hypothetical protein [Kitasatospora paranensis]|uniref:Uncharacterized protein n=1 Tax=Kitasatospora paranensis TaxID=258053 RepID=A0ABW2GB24_9ACTN